MLKAITYIDLVSCGGEAEAIAVLRAGVDLYRSKPDSKPHFPKSVQPRPRMPNTPPPGHVPPGGVAGTGAGAAL